MEKLTQKMRDDFQQFVAEIDVLLKELQEVLLRSRLYRDVQVNFEDETLDKIERFYLDVVDRKEKIDVPRARLDHMMDAYIGQAIIDRAGDEWVLGDDDFTFGFPAVATEGQMVFSPARRRKMLSEDREPFLRGLVDYTVNKEKLDEELFREFE